MLLTTVACALQVSPPPHPPPPPFWSKWYVPLAMTAIAPHPPSPVPPKPCTPHPVSGGISCASPGRPHTQCAGWRTKPLALPMKTSHASVLSLSSFHSAVRGDHCRRLSLSERRQFGREEESVLVYSGIILSFPLLPS